MCKDPGDWSRQLEEQRKEADRSLPLPPWFGGDCIWWLCVAGTFKEDGSGICSASNNSTFCPDRTGTSEGVISSSRI